MLCIYCGRDEDAVCMSRADMDPTDGINKDALCNSAYYELGGRERETRLAEHSGSTEAEGAEAAGNPGADYVSAADALHRLALDKVYSLMGATAPSELDELRKWADAVERYEDLRWPIGKPKTTN
jgi:hypothetical protein